MSDPRLHLDRTSRADDVSIDAFAEDVQYYLNQQPRQLPSRYLYDQLGSALFDAICRLPWYGITRSEIQLLRSHAAGILAGARRIGTIVELGGGNGEKLVAILEAGRPAPRPAIHLIDVSAAALALSARAIAAAGDFSVIAHEARYETGLLDAAAERRGSGRSLTLFLGSNIGNFDPPAADAFLRAVRASMRQGDAFLLGADLVKPEPTLVAAYDDPLGVTAAFNRNLLVRINAELGGDFDLRHFSHRAVWNADASRVEMHLVSRRPQRVRVERAELDFEIAEGETIWTESSYKYTPAGIRMLLEPRGFRQVEQWVDQKARFALTLADAV